MPDGRDLGQLPKAHLHLHLDGAMRRSTLPELAEAAGVAAPLPTAYGSFAAFTETITAAASCLRTPDDARRLVREVVEDAATAGAVWAEVSMWPGLFAGRLGDNGYRRSRAFAWDRIIDRLEVVYESLRPAKKEAALAAV